MQQQITRGDYLEDLITIYVENNLQTELTDLYSQFVFQCGTIQKFLTPAQVIKISFSEQESQQLTNYNICYLAGITVDGHKETFNGSLAFNTRGEVVFYEPTPNGSVQSAATSDNSSACPCQGISGVFANCSQPAIKAYFSLNYVPTKLSELTNDTDFQDSVDVADSIAEHNVSESAHPYIQSVLASTTEALAVSIQAETTARIDAVSLAISTTEAYTDSVVSVGTEATKAYADSIVSAATTVTEAYTDSVLQSATTAINTTIGDLSELDTSVKSSVTKAINAEVSARQSADNNLQNQIDALAAASDVTDIVGTYADLQSYDTQHLNNNDIIKVLSDSTHDDEPSYYRFDKDTDTFSYIGSESAAYTKAQSNSIFVTQTTTVNGKALSSDISLTYSDVDALSETYATVISGNTSAIAANTTAIASNTSVISQHTTAIATNTNAISTINGKIPTDASTTNKLVSASTLAASIADFANKDLNNLSSTGMQKLRSLNAYSNNGELLQDADGLAFVEKYAHSTFDSSKFTKVGSPIITSDGIASGFSTSNYLNTVKLSVLQNKSYSIKGRWVNTGSNSTDEQSLFQFAYYRTYGGLIFKATTGDFFARGAFGVSGSSSGENISLGGKTLGTGINILDYRFDFNINTGKYSVYYIINESSDWQLAFEYTPTTANKQLYVINENPNNYLYIGSKQASFYIIHDAIDLKQFSITVDGVEVFSGNKTGIDTIKPDDYTVVGTPTITADGVASGLKANNYIKTDSLDVSKETTFKFSYNLTSKTQTSNCYLFVLTSINLTIYMNTSGNIQMYKGSTYSPSIQASAYNTGRLDFKLTVNNSSAVCNVLQNGSSVGSISVSYTATLDTSSVRFGADNTGGYGVALTGSFDLNSFRAYVYGNLVYQPCLKIPYTETKTGSKIVDSIYRDRVNDMAEQFGFANYYTLSDTDFTLPQVELYGLIGQKTLRYSYENGINKVELYSNRDLTQQGSCTSGVEVTFLRPFADTNYILTVPYSAKSTTAFTPTQTGDWKAEGKGWL